MDIAIHIYDLHIINHQTSQILMEFPEIFSHHEAFKSNCMHSIIIMAKKAKQVILKDSLHL